MRIVRDTLPDIERSVVASSDRMSVDQSLCYDSMEDGVYGPCKNVQVVIVRGLCSHWKQPMFFDFDRDMIRSMLYSVITSVQNVGFHVVGGLRPLADEPTAPEE